MGLSFITYLTQFPPHVAYDVIVNTLKSSILEIGFSIDNEPVFNGLLDQLYPFDNSLPSQSISVVQSKSPVPDSLQDQPDSFQDQSDSFPDQPDSLPDHKLDHLKLSRKDNNDITDSLMTNGGLDSKTDQPDHLSHINDNNEDYSNSQYYKLGEQLFNCLNPTSLSRRNNHLSKGPETGHNVLIDIIYRSWNKWPFISDPENNIGFTQNWITLNGNEWLVKTK